jgi:hypothetical protein
MSLSNHDARLVDEYVRQRFDVEPAGGAPPAAASDPDPDPEVDEDAQLAAHIATQFPCRAGER